MVIDLKTKSEQIQKLCQVVLEIISDLKGEPGPASTPIQLPKFIVTRGELFAEYEDASVVSLGKVMPDAPRIDYDSLIVQILSKIKIPETVPVDVEAVIKEVLKRIPAPVKQEFKISTAEQVNIAKYAVAHIIENKLLPTPTSVIKQVQDPKILDLVNGCIETENSLYTKINELESRMYESLRPMVSAEQLTELVIKKLPQPEIVTTVVKGPVGPPGKDSLPEHVIYTSHTKDIRNTAKDVICDLVVGNGLQLFEIIALAICTDGVSKFKSKRELTVIKENGRARILEDKKVSSDFPAVSSGLEIIFAHDAEKITVYGTGILEQEVQWKLIVKRYG